MSPLLRRNQMIAYAFVLSCFACTDRTPTHSVPAPGWELMAAVQCRIHVDERTAECGTPSPAGGPSLALLDLDDNIRLRASHVAVDTRSQTVSMDVSVQNRLGYPIGTPDGQIVTGIKVFFETAPTGPGDSTTRVTVRNPDGRQNFTGAQQPYYHYDTILAPKAATAPKRWEFHVPRGVRTFGFTVRFFTATPAEQSVPQTAPDFKPACFYDPANSIDCGTLLTGTCLKNVVLVEFRGTATQEERQAAVDLIRGEVVGGQTGAYFIRIPTPDSSYASLLGHVLRQLENLPQIEYASAYLTTRPAPDFAQPHDTAGWRNWRLNPDSADGANWAFERVGAPFAWGCSTGDTSTVIGIVDTGFHTISDLTRNSNLMEGADAYADNVDHGTSVAAIAAGSGNDSVGVAGMMWRAKLRMYDHTAGGVGDWQDVWENVRQAGSMVRA